jgi:spore coat protein YutH
MENYINYYYNLNPEKIEEKRNGYYFNIGQDKYYFIPCERNVEEIPTLYRLNYEMIRRNSLVHEIILNKNNEILTTVDEKIYIMLRVYVNEEKIVDLDDILFMLDNNEGILPNNVLNRMNWTKLWAEKIDYFEYQIIHLARKYNMLYKTLDYYVGLAENALAYIKQIEKENRSNILAPITVSHKRVYIKYTLFDLYNPLNFIIDYKIRDISEYIKMSFFEGIDVWKIVDYIFSFYKFTPYSLKLLYGRLLFPSYYFDIYEEIITNNLSENKILDIISKSDEYEKFLKDMYYYISDFVELEKVDWLIKKTS